jgi:ELWxxDGT repeat protein
VKDANASGNGVLAPLGGVVWRGRRWYAGTDGMHGFEPWSSDGTVAGTAMLLDVSGDATSSRPDGFAVAGDALYFAATHPLTGRELWRTRGTAETTELVQDLAYGATGSSPSWLTPVDGTLFFVASTDQLWVADAAGVRMVKDFGALGSPDAPANLVAFAGKLYFTARHPDAGVELWSSDGTAEGTAVVKDVNPSGGSFPSGLAVANGALWFAADDGAHGSEPWSSDGTPDGTDLVADVSTTAGASSSPSGFVAAGGAVFFAADDGNDGVELWKATAGGAELVLDIAFDPPGEAPVGSSPRYLSALGDALLFSAWQLGAGAELWRSDGTAGGTALVWEIDPGDGWGY